MNYEIGYIFYDDEDYSNVAQWCNENGYKIDLYEKDDNGVQRYIIAEIPATEPMPIDDTPSLEDRVSAIEEAMLEMMIGGAE